VKLILFYVYLFFIVASEQTPQNLTHFSTVIGCEIIFIKDHEPWEEDNYDCIIIVKNGIDPPNYNISIINAATPKEVILFIISILLILLSIFGLLIHWWDYEKPWTGLIMWLVKPLQYLLKIFLH
jgi:hypothetical protein